MGVSGKTMAYSDTFSNRFTDANAKQLSNGQFFHGQFIAHPGSHSDFLRNFISSVHALPIADTYLPWHESCFISYRYEFTPHQLTVIILSGFQPFSTW